ncbi:unnamed protein product (macronuclear) [Paramecium tetraurelia]|uniref:Uncharacterized protein n=1 Tax=Paramecium tetraurelia TaxID=5888 RepID=A0C2V6_PARTE|nr:uncharacterized protein GSPATT00034601001 [Paramecium tetraurelia]CAK65123.1 unnamed protein product [Paramecium tetraurelia]|eukprot:XP_001432520.1 hypothetical protein (macronuclear) [Paramecium tetraurelia strain d4-2]
MDAFNLLNNRFMQSAKERKSLRSINLSQKNLETQSKSSEYDLWEKNDGLDSPMTPKIEIPNQFYPKLINTVRLSNQRLL